MDAKNNFIFFDGQRKRSKRKAALNLAFGYPRFHGCLRRVQKLASLRQFGLFVRMQPLRSAALNGI
jgi:hypothetical protein